MLLTLTALSGEFPTAQVSRLPSTGTYQEKILKSLKGEKLLRTYYRDGLRALRLTTAAKKLLVDKWPDRFLPYLSGSTETWEYKAEMRLKAMLQTELCQCRLPGQYQNAALNAIVFGRDMEQMLPLMNDSGGQRDYFVLDGNYQHFYYLTSDHHGELILQLFCDAEQQAVLDAILSQDLSPCRSDWVVENDAMDGDSPVLFAYTCDMPRIKRFDTALSCMGKRGRCFASISRRTHCSRSVVRG